jgi:predicted ATPase
MKISIYNFKSIGSLVEYEVKPLTILSGTNSSGKSSFIQLLLLLKQTIQLDSAQYPLFLNGEFFNVKGYFDIIRGKESSNKLKVVFKFDKSELTDYRLYDEISFYETIGYSTLSISIEFDFVSNKILISEFDVRFLLPDTSKGDQFITFINNSSNFSIVSNTGVFNESLFYQEGKYTIKNISYSSVFPASYEIEIKGVSSRQVPKLEGVKAIIRDFFKRVNYIGPLREQPKDEYKNTGSDTTVGIKGEYVAEVFSEHSDQETDYIVVEEENDTVRFVPKRGTFLDAVKYWLCEKFELCEDIYSKKTADSYIIYVRSHMGIESTIKHVGFGVSQILPIIVEGLALPTGNMLILEQPEIHLHPKIQSRLFDFLIGIVLQGKRVLIETHSDHLITRLRRRIAEDQEGLLASEIGLTFIESKAKDLLFRNIGIDDFGGLDYFPDNFIEKADVELRAILKAQMKKKLLKKD